jgi:hypothetical protein
MDEGNFYMISTYPNLPKDDERRKAYFDGVSDGIKQGRSGNQKECPSCRCVVDEKGHGHHSVADCIFMRMAAEEKADGIAQGRREAAEALCSICDYISLGCTAHCVSRKAILGTASKGEANGI